jgi:DMSO reductase anchor subunit
MTARSGHTSLVAFTSMAVAGAGLVAASACFELAYGVVCVPAAPTGAVLLAAGLAVSLGHLGQKHRAGLAARRAGRSPLSNEGLLAGLALATAATAAGLDLGGADARTATAVAGTTSAAFLVSIGLVYQVRGQQTWQGFSAATPLTGGLAFGAIAAQSLLLSGATGVFRGTLMLVAIDALVFVQRWREVAGIPLPRALLADPQFARRDQLLGARFFLLDVVPAILMVAWPTPLAAAVAATGVIADRIGFYALAIRHDTEHEVAAVEDRIAALERSAPP